MKNICIVTVAFEGITRPHTPPGKNDGLEGGAYDHGLLLESNQANTKKKTMEGQIDLDDFKIEQDSCRSKLSSKFPILLFFFCETNIMPYNS